MRYVTPARVATVLVYLYAVACVLLDVFVWRP